MRRLAIVLFSMLATGPGLAGEAEIKAAQGSVEAQLRAFQSGDGALAYSYAAPNIKRIFPTLEAFMSMVTNGYPPIANPDSFQFGASEEPAAGIVRQQVLVIGPDGRSYDALYTLELQPDGTFRITSVIVRLSTMASA